MLDRINGPVINASNRHINGDKATILSRRPKTSGDILTLTVNYFDTQNDILSHAR
jgi:hypothetical protein